MMRPQIFLLATFLLIMLVPAYGQDQERIDFVMSGKSEFRGRLYEYSINNNDFKNTPSWDSTTGEPPLSVSEALKIARRNMSIFLSDTRGWEATSIRLTSTSQRKWYYFVTFSCMKPVCVEGSGTGFNILVKLDGTVVQPKITPVEKRDTTPR